MPLGPHSLSYLVGRAGHGKLRIFSDPQCWHSSRVSLSLPAPKYFPRHFFLIGINCSDLFFSNCFRLIFEMDSQDQGECRRQGRKRSAESEVVFQGMPCKGEPHLFYTGSFLWYSLIMY